MGGGLRQEQANQFAEVRRVLQAQQPCVRLERNGVALHSLYQTNVNLGNINNANVRCSAVLTNGRVFEPEVEHELVVFGVDGEDIFRLAFVPPGLTPLQLICSFGEEMSQIDLARNGANLMEELRAAVRGHAPNAPQQFFVGVIVDGAEDPIPLLQDVDVAQLTADSVLVVKF